jgi:RNA polymerase sigma factor (sigma-70 family)
MSSIQPLQQAHDELLALRCQLGERAAFDDLIRTWAPSLRRHVLRVSGYDSAADDLVQEIWLGVVKGIARLRDPARLRSWLFGIAHRVLVDRLRTSYSAAIDADVDVDSIAGDARTLDREAVAQEVERGLSRVALLEREVLDLFYLQELSLADVAAALDVPVGTVKSRLFRAREALRVVLVNSEIAP